MIKDAGMFHPNEFPQRPAQGKRILAALHSNGIDALDVTRNRKSGCYEVRFGAQNITQFSSRGTEPAREWARRILERFDGVEVVDTYDSVADWRPQRPVLLATVFLRGEPIPKTA